MKTKPRYLNLLTHFFSEFLLKYQNDFIQRKINSRAGNQRRLHIYVWKPEGIWEDTVQGVSLQKSQQTHESQHEKKLIPDLGVSGEDKVGTTETEERDSQPWLHISSPEEVFKTNHVQITSQSN